MLDPATLRQMTRPRCGVADTDSQAVWTERVSALFAGQQAKMRRQKRFTKQGEHGENLVRLGFPTVLKPHGQKKQFSLRLGFVNNLVTRAGEGSPGPLVLEDHVVNTDT